MSTSRSVATCTSPCMLSTWSGWPILPLECLTDLDHVACRTCPTCQGYVVNDAYYGPELVVGEQQFYAIDADECCVACLLRAGCAAWLFLKSPTATLHTCTLRSAIDYIVLRDSSQPGFTIYSGSRSYSNTPQLSPPPPGGLPGPRY
jgi:hypothetical protein